jgi:aryl-alcohol dehydrogenase-like predicted oxidoreductase
MEYRYLGRTGLLVSAVGFGTMTFGGARSDFFRPVGTTELDDARRQVAMCLDAGLNLFDTADAYSNGASEEMLGAALGARRLEAVLATKLHARTGPGPNDVGQSRAHILAAVDASLRRLGTDWIDLLQVHGFDGRTDLEESLRALDDVVRAGKVRYIGCSNHAAWHLMKALAVSERLSLERYCCLQAHYSLVARELEWELMPLCLDQRVGILVWSPLAGGLLTGKFRRGRPAPEGARAARNGPPGGLPDEEQALDVIEELVAIAEARGVGPAQVALNWVVARPGVSAAIVGARDATQLADTLSAAGWRLEPEEIARLDRASAVRIPYPQWHQQRFNRHRLDEPWMHFARPEPPPG